MALRKHLPEINSILKDAAIKQYHLPNVANVAKNILAQSEEITPGIDMRMSNLTIVRQDRRDKTYQKSCRKIPHHY